MMNSLFAGVSGLKAFETKMDVIGNNIANVNTSGFKTGRVTFSELLSQNIRREGVNYASAPRVQNQIGVGVRVSSIDRNFDQGSLESTGVSTDLAIQGDSFFLVNNGDSRLLTRAGGFKFNATGQLVSATGNNVQGYNADINGNIIPGAATQDVFVNFGDVYRPNQTQKVTVAGNLNANTSQREVLSQISAFTADGAIAESDTDLNDLDQVLLPGGLNDGDSFSYNVTLTDGTTQTATFTYGSLNDGTTINDLVSTLNAEFGAGTSVSLEDGLIVIRENAYGDSALSLTMSSRINRDPSSLWSGALNTSNLREVTQNGRFSINGGNPVALSTQLANLDQFDDLVAGDTIDITGVDETGAAVTSSFTIATGTETVSDFMSFLEGAFTGTTATLNSQGEIVLTGSEANDVDMELTNIGYTTLGTGSFDTSALNYVALDAPNYQTTVEGSFGSKILSSTVYDSQGEAHTVVLELSQTDFNRWSYTTRFLNGETILNEPTGSLIFDADGNFVSILDSDGSEIQNINVSFTPGNGAGNMSFDIDLKGSPVTGRLTQFDGLTTVKVTGQDGNGKGELLDVFVDSEGRVIGSYSNGKTKDLAQLALAQVNNMQGLEHVGEGMFQITNQAGNVIIDTASNLAGEKVNSGFLEGSNVDLAEQFTEMIITQRAYQSNARVITTADQLLAEAVQLKR
jgi:flagellar hook protein FlgE